MELPTPWELRESIRYPGRVFYYNKCTKETTWIRPIPYPGHRISWPPAVFVLHIMIRDDKSNRPSKRTPEEAEQKIMEIRRELLLRKRTFEEIAKAQSEDDETYDKGGVVGWIKKGKMPQEFEKIAWQLHIGELSSPIHTECGWHLILRRG